VALNAWTKIGDQHDPSGQWTLYQHKARLLSEVEEVTSWKPEEEMVAIRAFHARAEKIHRGGLWLVSPTGRVTCSLWVPVRIRKWGE
jgi:hypothetical protein